MAQRFDLVAIGTGEAASPVAWRFQQAGRRVAVVDSRPYGGTCALRGCDPKKVLVGAAEALDRIQRMRRKGLEAEAARIDWPALMRFKRTFTRPVPEAREKEFVEGGIAALHGRARFVGPRKLRVGDENIEADYFVIATGARPATLRFPGAEHLITSEQFLELDSSRVASPSWAAVTSPSSLPTLPCARDPRSPFCTAVRVPWRHSIRTWSKYS